MNHWTEVDFQQGLYGLKDDDPHLAECAVCRSELARRRDVRARSVADPEVSNEFLAEQRRNIYRRLEEPRRNWVAVRWALSAAMLVALVFGGLTWQRSRQTVAPLSDEQLFSDLSAMEQSAEPKAIQPMHGLFVE
jgi:predicted anti-sigma-YlaC factor YlaD